MNKILPIGNVLFNTSRIYYKGCNDCSGYGSSLILIKGCRLSVKDVVDHVVAQVVTYNMAYVVGCFVLNFVVVICKCFCNIIL